MRKHNRSLGFIFIFVILILGIILYQSRALFISEEQAPNLQSSESEQTLSQEQMAVSESQIPFLEIVKKIKDCLQIEAEYSKELGANIESLFLILQPIFGPQTVKDKSLVWRLRNPDGIEKKIYLSIVQNEEDKIIKQLDFFSVDSHGNEVRIDLEPEKTLNPSDEYMNQLLKGAQVIEKIKSSVAEFPNGALLNYQEKDGVLIQFDIQYNKTSFSCSGINNADTCQCQQ